MKKEDLIAMGLSEEQAENVMKSLDGNYVPKQRFNEVNEKFKTAEKTVAERDKQLEELKKSGGDSETLKKQIEQLQKDNAEQKKAHDAEIAQIQLDNAINSALTGAGAKNNIAVRAMLGDTSKLKVGDDGTVKGLDDLIKAVQKSDPYMFNTPQQNKFSGFEPGNAGDVKPNSAVDMSKMSLEELTAYMEANPNA